MEGSIVKIKLHLLTAREVVAAVRRWLAGPRSLVQSPPSAFVAQRDGGGYCVWPVIMVDWPRCVLIRCLSKRGLF